MSLPVPVRPFEAASASLPAKTDRRADEAADLAACRVALRNGSRTFLAASFLLPRRVHQPAAALYAFCRLADDAIDGPGGRADALLQLRRRIAAAYAGQPHAAAADRALAVVVARHRIPVVCFDALLEGFEWDLAGRRYDTLDELQAYAARVAGSVGAMMALLMGVRSEEGLARACDLGVAMQLSNIARDVGEDARMGRLYLPRDWLLEAGIDPDAWLAAPVFGPALASVVRRLLAAADALYDQVDAGVARLPLGCRPGINAARFLYAEIGREVARRGHDSVTRRARVPGWRKAWLLGRAVCTLAPSSAALRVPVLPANRFLVDAGAVAPSSASPGLSSGAPVPGASADAGLTPRSIAAKLLWTAELFARLEQRERLAVGRPLHRTG